MALRVKIPCELVEEGEVEAIVSLDDPYSNSFLVELPEEIDVDEHLTLAEMGYDLPDCVQFKVDVEKGHGLRNIFSKEEYFQAFFEAIEAQGPQAIGDKETWEVDEEAVAGALAILLVDAMAHGSDVKTDMDFELVVEIIKEHWEGFFKTNAYHDKEMELVRLAYENEEHDFIKKLDEVTQSTLYEVNVQETSSSDGPGHAKVMGFVTLTVGEETVDEWDVCYLGYVDLEMLDWEVEQCDEHGEPTATAEDFLDTMGEGTDFESEFRLYEPDVPYDEGEGRYSVFVNDVRVATFDDYSDADNLFDALEDSRDVQNKHDSIALMELDDELDPEEDDIDLDDPGNYFTMRS
jgi:hypothetical protein